MYVCVCACVTVCVCRCVCVRVCMRACMCMCLWLLIVSACSHCGCSIRPWFHIGRQYIPLIVPALVCQDSPGQETCQGRLWWRWRTFSERQEREKRQERKEREEREEKEVKCCEVKMMLLLKTCCLLSALMKWVSSKYDLVRHFVWSCQAFGDKH